MRVIISGSRDWKEEHLIRAAIGALPADTLVAHGACRGADEIAGGEAFDAGLAVAPFSADWNRQGKSAGPKRNARMLRVIEPHLVIAFHDEIEKSKGTRHMLRISGKAGVPVLAFGTCDDEIKIARMVRATVRRIRKAF